MRSGSKKASLQQRAPGRGLVKQRGPNHGGGLGQRPHVGAHAPVALAHDDRALPAPRGVGEPAPLVRPRTVASTVSGMDDYTALRT
jgi:hypothetical protein